MTYFIIFLIRAILFILSGYLIWTQIIIPAIKGTRLFPVFSSKRKQLQHDLEEVNEQLEIDALEDKLKALKDKRASRTTTSTKPE